MDAMTLNAPIDAFRSLTDLRPRLLYVGRPSFMRGLAEACLTSGALALPAMFVWLT